MTKFGIGQLLYEVNLTFVVRRPLVESGAQLLTSTSEFIPFS